MFWLSDISKENLKSILFSFSNYMDKILIVKLVGGLGNQMFQYAAARAASCRTKIPFKLDITFYKKSNLRSYRLNHFNIIENIATEDDIKRFIIPSKRKTLQYCNYIIKKKIFCSNSFRRIKQISTKYCQDIFNIKGSSYITGYWQSEKYFIDKTEIIRKELTVKNEPDEKNSKYLKFINETNSVSLHIRRGDYAYNPEAYKTYGLLDLDYYTKAIEYISDRVKRINIFAFSDDISWVKKEIKTRFPIYYIDFNGADKDYEDLRLMYNCKHHIIANSSFSWWGAWLSDNPRKIVIAPMNWYAKRDINSEDIYGNNWIRL